MDDTHSITPPHYYHELLQKSNQMGFSMSSDVYIGSLLRTLVSSKPSGNFLELGTGMSLTTSWILEGLDKKSKCTTIDNDASLIAICKSYFENNPQVDIVCADGGEWLDNYKGESFDLIFADAWPGKYEHLDEALALVKIGGFYVIDDMTETKGWPDEHKKKASNLMRILAEREDFIITKMNWSTGIIIATRVVIN